LGQEEDDFTSSLDTGLDAEDCRQDGSFGQADDFTSSLDTGFGGDLRAGFGTDLDDASSLDTGLGGNFGDRPEGCGLERSGEPWDRSTLG
jgi:hypothetical protein